MCWLLLIPQRYEFSSKSQPVITPVFTLPCCCWYHKGTNFQANHNCQGDDPQLYMLLLIPQRYEFSSKSQLRWRQIACGCGCCWYHKGTNFQANHNNIGEIPNSVCVVADTTKVRIFKQITTYKWVMMWGLSLLLIPQRYEFSSKSQPMQDAGLSTAGCCWYHKGTNFQANHNSNLLVCHSIPVVADTTKVRIFKQITTRRNAKYISSCCCWYHKGTNFQANHNWYVGNLC